MKEKKFMWDPKNSIASKVLALHIMNQGLLPGTPYDPWFSPGIIPGYRARSKPWVSSGMTQTPSLQKRRNKGKILKAVGERKDTNLIKCPLHTTHFRFFILQNDIVLKYKNIFKLAIMNLYWFCFLSFL